MSTDSRPRAAGADPALPPSGDGTVSRVSVLAPRTRIDLALPADVAIADLVPAVLVLAGEPAGTGPAWTLALLGHGPADPERTLAGLGVLDGDQLVLRPDDAAAPAPLYDDVVDAVAEVAPPAYRAWTPASARRVGRVALGAALAVAVLTLVAVGRGPGTAGGAITAAVAGLGALAAVAGGATAARWFARPATGAVVAAAGVALAAVCGVAAVPVVPGGGADPVAGADLLAGAGVAHLLLGAVLALVTAGLGLVSAGDAGRAGLVTLLAAAAGAGLLAVTALGAVVARGLAPPGGGPSAAAVAAGAGALAVLALAGLPRAGVALAHLPLPPVPGSAEELADDPEVADHAEIERRADRAHAALSGLVAGVGAVAAGAAGVLAAVPDPGWRGPAGGALAVLLVVLLALRSRTYANAVHVSVLLVTALAGGVAVVVAGTLALPPGAPRLVATAVALGAAAAVATLAARAGTRSSPTLRRAVDVAEAVATAAVLPLALGVMDLYRAIRLL